MVCEKYLLLNCVQVVCGNRQGSGYVYLTDGQRRYPLRIEIQ